MGENIGFVLNGKTVELVTDPERKLLWVLRTDLGLTGTKYGCGEGICGACTVVAGGRAIRSCQTPLSEVRDKEVLTIEGLSRNGRLHPLQRAFLEQGAFQCGYCTPGMIMTAYALLLVDSQPSEEKIVRAMDDNLCRCGAYERIIRAVKTAARGSKKERNEYETGK